MKKSLVLWACLLASLASFAQAPTETAPAATQQQTTATTTPQGPQSLRERFLYMKSKSSSYGEYKVVKESVLDGVWKITNDSIAAKAAALKAANQNIITLRTEVEKVNAAAKAKDQAMKDITYDADHINVIGIDFGKSTFLIVVACILGGLIGFAVFMYGRMQLQSKSLSERKLAVTALTHEFEEYKQRAMEKQTKLSRELQDERNKLQSMRHS